MKCITLAVGGLAVVGRLELELVAVRNGQAALRSDGGLVLLGWPGDSIRIEETTIKITRVQPSRVTLAVESPEVVRRQ